MKSFLIAIALLINTTAAWAEPKGLADLDAAMARIATRFQSGVAGVRSDVSTGVLQFSTPESCEGKTSCFGNNPSSPYGSLAIQLAPGQPVPPAIPGVDVAVPPGHFSYFHFRPDDSIILMGWMPTDLTYFGFTPYLFARKDADSGEYRVIFGAVNDTLNHLVIKSSGGSSGAFGRFVAVIFAADQKSEARARAVLRLEGIPDSVINVVVFPKSFPLTLGWQSDADMVGALLRLGLPTNSETVAEYLSNTPLRALHVTPAQATTTYPIPMGTLRTVGTGKCEGGINLQTGCTQALDPALPNTLASAAMEILNRLTSTTNGLSPIQIETIPNVATEKTTLGAFCAAGLSNCNGDNRDTIYTVDVDEAVLSTDPNDFLLFVGVNHVSYGKATYFNHSIYRALTFAGVEGITNLDFQDSQSSSIEYYLGRPTRTPTERQLYAYTVARDCGSRRFCREIQSSGPTGVPLDEPIRVMARMYLEPSTRVKPSENEILFHRVYRSLPK